jgi:hypothetical protein
LDSVGAWKARVLSPPSAEDLYLEYPRLSSSDHKITSEANDQYNCVAWVDRVMNHWFEPEIFWPPGVPVPLGQDDLDCYVALFRQWGFEECASRCLESGFLKIAIYAVGQEFEHVAKQLPSGQWSSKGGVLHDFKHRELDALGDCRAMRRAEPALFMRRPYDGSDLYEVEENGLIL